jgi:hypothetical protein
MPSPVCFSSDTDSIVEVTVISSPGRRSRTYSCSQLVATTDVKPWASRSRSRSSCRLPPAGGGGRNPRICHVWSIVGGAMMPPWTDAAAAGSSE